MCYHSLFLFLQCGHVVASSQPLPQAPPCPIKHPQLFEDVSQSSPVLSDLQLPYGYEPLDPPDTDPFSPSREMKEAETTCTTLLSHPLHTYRIDDLCKTCLVEKETRIAQFDLISMRKTVDREYGKNFRKHKVEVHGRKPRTLRAGYEAGKRGLQHDQLRNEHGLGVTVQSKAEDVNVDRFGVQLKGMLGSSPSFVHP